MIDLAASYAAQTAALRNYGGRVLEIKVTELVNDFEPAVLAEVRLSDLTTYFVADAQGAYAYGTDAAKTISAWASTESNGFSRYVSAPVKAAAQLRTRQAWQAAQLAAQ